MADGGGCLVPLTADTCGPDAECQVGDDCSAFYNDGGADPCMKDGLFCALLGVTPAQALLGGCLQPFVTDPADGFPSSSTPCNPANNRCSPAADSAQNTPSVCASYWAAAGGAPVCLASCQSSTDCSSLAENCVNGTCVPVYCYADGMLQSGMTVADYFTTLQGSPVVSPDNTVLFQPCEPIGGAPSYCLPQLDALTNAASGICFRVGEGDAGGIGSACDSNLYGNNGSIPLCAQGFLCNQGSCLSWCDVSGQSGTPCLTNTTCVVDTYLPFIVSPTTEGTGVCVQPCDPYAVLGDAGNGCVPFVDDAVCREAIPVCKLTGSDTNPAPPPGLCVNGVANPLPVGAICDPVSVVDPCVSNAMCLPYGSLYVCAQLCDADPPVDVPSTCTAGTTCQPLPCNNATGLCDHEGACQ